MTDYQTHSYITRHFGRDISVSRQIDVVKIRKPHYPERDQFERSSILEILGWHLFDIKTRSYSKNRTTDNFLHFKSISYYIFFLFFFSIRHFSRAISSILSFQFHSITQVIINPSHAESHQIRYHVWVLWMRAMSVLLPHIILFHISWDRFWVCL